MMIEWLAPVIIDLSDRSLVLPSGQIVPVAIGKSATPTPIGEFTVRRKVLSPNGTSSGTYGSIGIEFLPGYGIHGTSDQSSIGKAVSAGCIRVPRWAEPLIQKEVTWITPIIIRR